MAEVMIGKQATIDALKQHYAKVYNANSFEEFKLVQLEYIGGLIKRAEIIKEYEEKLNNMLIVGRIVEN